MAARERGEQNGEKGRGGVEHRRQPGVHRLLGPGDQGEWHDAIESGLQQERRPGPSIPRRVQAAPEGDAEQQQACDEGTGRDQGDRRNGFDADADEGVGRTPAGGEREQHGQFTDDGDRWAGWHGVFSVAAGAGHRKVSCRVGSGCFVLEQRVASCTGAAERLHRVRGDLAMPREARCRGRWVFAYLVQHARASVPLLLHLEPCQQGIPGRHGFRQPAVEHDAVAGRRTRGSPDIGGQARGGILCLRARIRRVSSIWQRCQRIMVGSRTGQGRWRCFRAEAGDRLGGPRVLVFRGRCE